MVAAAAFLLAAPTVLAFFSGGYYAEPRLVAALVAWAIVLALAVAGPAPLPRSREGALALGGLVALTAWSAVSIAWAPLAGPALENVQRLVLYVGGLALAISVMRLPWALRAVEPALAAGATIVIGYGLAGRVLPRVVELDRSITAGGRLEQPLTYWNAEGVLAAVGLILCARLAGDPSRPRWLRALAAAAAAPLGAGIYISFSRGAIAVAALGLIALVALAPTRGQLRGSVVALGAAFAAAAAAGVFPGVASLDGSLSDRTRDGAIVLVALVAIAATAGVASARLPVRDALKRLPRPGRIRRLAIGAVLAVALGLVAGGLAERPSADERSATGARAERLVSVSSNRYEYWRVGLNAFAENPLGGVGSGGFRVEWLRERTIAEGVRDAHSLEIEVLAELGLVGLVALAAMVAGVALASRRTLAARPELAAGPTAALGAWFLHASIDWDWQLPAVTLPAIALAGALIAIAEGVSRAAPAQDRAAPAPPVPAGPPARRARS
jgi:O-antigen ligase/polysaccharide polymerase Wzy-like membrane protein